MTVITGLHKHIQKFLNSHTRKQGLLLVMLICSVYMMIPAVSAWITHTDIRANMRLVGVMDMDPAFADSYNITTAIESQHNGFNPLQTNPVDITGRPMNYPRIWLWLEYLGISIRNTSLLAECFIFLFVLSFFFIIKNSNNSQGIIYSIALCSPPVLLAIERGNNDLFIFSLLVFSSILSSEGIGSQDRISIRNIASHLFLLLSSILKLFPVIILISQYIEQYNTTSKKKSIVMGICLVIFAVYVIFSLDDIIQIAKVVPSAISTSFGSMVMPDYILRKLAKFGVPIPRMYVRLLIVFLCFALPILFYIRNIRLSYSKDNSIHSTIESRLFKIASIVFCTVFILGNNFDYRLIFVLLMIPQLLHRITSENDKIATLMIGTILCLLWLSFYISSSYSGLKDILNMVSECCAWLIYTLCGTWLIGLAVDSFRNIGIKNQIIQDNQTPPHSLPNSFV